MSIPQVTTRCVAHQYAEPDERIIEFSSTVGGGLISFCVRSDGRLQVNLYHLDKTVDVGVPSENLAFE